MDIPSAPTSTHYCRELAINQLVLPGELAATGGRTTSSTTSARELARGTPRTANATS